MKPKSKKSIKLSNNLLKMKFMKKTAVQEQEELALEEQNHLIDDEHWYFDVEEKKEADSQGRTVRVEPSYSAFENIGFGRFSFNGFNPQIEKLNQAVNNEDGEKDGEKEINDKEMASYYQQSSSLVETLSKRFAKVQKQKHPKVKRL